MKKMTWGEMIKRQRLIVRLAKKHRTQQEYQDERSALSAMIAVRGAEQ